MFRRSVISLSAIPVLFGLLLMQDAAAQDDWANWRGPTGNGIAASGQTPPTKWDASTNVLWKVQVPGRGHSSPTVVGDKIFLTTSNDEKQEQSVVCFERKTGKQIWQTQLYQGGYPARIHPKNTHASPSLACDGERVFAVFQNHGKTHAAALDFDGKVVWKKEVGTYKSKYPFGFGQTPIVYKSKVFVTSDSLVDSAIVAYDGKTGEEQFRIKRPKISSYSTPMIAKVAGKTQLFISGGQQVASYDPDQGTENWRSPASWVVSCGTVVWDDDSKLVFASGGFPTQQTLALDARNGELVWENSIKSYEQSMIVVDGYVYTISDNGIAYCWKASDGTEMWKQRLQKEESASPVLAGGNLYITVEKGTTFVIKPNPKKFELVAENKLGDSAFATPSFVGNQIFYRAGFNEGGKRQEWLYCLGSE